MTQTTIVYHLANRCIKGKAVTAALGRATVVHGCFRATHRQDGDLGEVVEGLPLSLEVLQRSHKHNVLQLVVVEVARPQRHDEVAKADQRRLDVSKNADDHVAAQHGHGRLAAGLSRRTERGRKHELVLSSQLLTHENRSNSSLRNCMCA